jgi:3-oxoacyl-[acyl-carrier protein] reductase
MSGQPAVRTWSELKAVRVNSGDARVALVTGAAKGIGRGLALDLATAGFVVAVHYRSSAVEADGVVSEIRSHGGSAQAFQADLTDDSAARAMVNSVALSLGGLHVVINNVGNFVIGPLATYPAESWRDMFATNLDATFAVCQSALVHMRAQGFGRIVNFGFAGTDRLLARPQSVAYVIAKTGVTLLTKAIALSEIANGITANVIAPGIIETSVGELPQIPAGRFGTIDDVRAAVRFFVSDDANYITGQTLEVAGGWHL